MKTLLTLFSSALFVSQMSYANVSNGDFENWTDNIPDNWGLIDSGISVSESTNIVKTGNSSVAISVNTSTQSATDFLQSVSVISGNTYDFSVWVYHTEGGVKARIYVDGYQGYSDESTTGQWQQISYSYSASSSTNINVGLRFYDTSSFDGAELLYVDNFEPDVEMSDADDSSNSCNTNSGSIRLITDNYADETSWQIIDNNSNVLESGSNYSSNSSYEENICLDDGNYTFIISDTYGDGICCSYGSGSYSVVIEGNTVASGGRFTTTESTAFTLGESSNSSGDSASTDNLSEYYSNAQGLSGYTLKTALYNIINNHASQSYADIWTFYSSNSLDVYYEKDNSIVDMYSESPSVSDSYNFTAVSDQCGNYSAEGDCYNREHSFPRSWFGGAISPMNTDIHHIFASDGYVNGKRSSYPYGEVSTISYTSDNGSLLGSGSSSLGYTGTVFEPIDEFKGDFARAYFYMATRYQNLISGWENNSSYADAVLDGSSSQVFDSWFLDMLKDWHTDDPVSEKELDRNEAAYSFQGNRNPFVDYPDFVSEIWAD